MGIAMLMLLVTVVLGIVLAIFATQNTGAVNLSLGEYYLPNVPIYLIVLVPLAGGFAIAWIVYLAKTLAQSLVIGEQTKEISGLKAELVAARKRAHELELENIKLKAKSGEFDENSI
jgi:uncharacterized integral membrane protein